MRSPGLTGQALGDREEDAGWALGHTGCQADTQRHKQSQACTPCPREAVSIRNTRLGCSSAGDDLPSVSRCWLVPHLHEETQTTHASAPVILSPNKIQDDLRLLTLLPALPECRGHRRAPPASFLRCWGWTQGSVHTRSALYQLNYIPRPG